MHIKILIYSSGMQEYQTKITPQIEFDIYRTLDNDGHLEKCNKAGMCSDIDVLGV